MTQKATGLATKTALTALSGGVVVLIIVVAGRAIFPVAEAQSRASPSSASQSSGQIGGKNHGTTYNNNGPVYNFSPQTTAPAKLPSTSAGLAALVQHHARCTPGMAVCMDGIKDAQFTGNTIITTGGGFEIHNSTNLQLGGNKLVIVRHDR